MATEKQLTWNYVISSGTGDKCESPDVIIPGYSVYDYGIIQSIPGTGIITTTLCGSKSNEMIIESNSFTADGVITIQMFIPSLSGGSIYWGVDRSNWQRVGLKYTTGTCDSNKAGAINEMIEYKISGWEDGGAHKISIKVESKDDDCTQMVSFLDKVKIGIPNSTLIDTKKVEPKVEENNGYNPECVLINKAKNEEVSGGTCWWDDSRHYCSAGTIMTKLPKEKVVIHRSQLGINCFAGGGEVLMPGDLIYFPDEVVELKIWFQGEGYNNIQPDDLEYYKITPDKNKLYKVPQPQKSVSSQIGTFFQYLWRIPFDMITSIPSVFASGRSKNYDKVGPMIIMSTFGDEGMAAMARGEG